MLHVLVLYYSRNGSTAQLARPLPPGFGSVGGIQPPPRAVPPVSADCEATGASVPETGAPYCSLAELAACDGLVMGSPTRFGNMAAPLKYFLDGSSGLWLSGALIGKPAAVFTSTGSLHGGQESTLLSMMLPLMHHGMVIAGLPYSEPALSTTTSGGTPYGASHYAGSSNTPRKPDSGELLLAERLGARIAQLALRLKP